MDEGTGEYKLLYEPITAQYGYGTLYYDENQGRTITSQELAKTYGLVGANTAAGIYELTEQPNFPVANFIKSGDFYVPTRSYSRLFFCLLKAVAVAWAANTSYTKDQIVEYNNFFYCVTTDFTSGDSFNTTGLNPINASSALATAFAPLMGNAGSTTLYGYW